MATPRRRKLTTAEKLEKLNHRLVQRINTWENLPVASVLHRGKVKRVAENTFRKPGSIKGR